MRRNRVRKLVTGGVFAYAARVCDAVCKSRREGESMRMHRGATRWLVVAGLLGLVGTAAGDTLLEAGFDDLAPGALTGQAGGTGWGTEAWQNGGVGVVTNTPLSFAVDGGGMIDGGTQSAYLVGVNTDRRFPAFTRTVYFRMLVRAVPDAVGNHEFFARLNGWNTFVAIKNSTDISEVRLDGGAAPQAMPLSFVAGKDYLLVGRLDYDGGSFTNLALWVDPAYTNEPTPHNAITGSMAAANVTNLNFRAQNKDFLVDEILFATTWDEVVPPAAAPPTPMLVWDPDPFTPDPQGGSGTWNGAHSNWWDGAGNTNWDASYAAVFSNMAGSVSLGASLSAAGLQVTDSNYVFTLANRTLTLTGASSGSPRFNFSAQQSGGVTLAADTDFAGRFRYGRPHVTVDGASATFSGRFDCGEGQAKMFVVLTNDAHLTFTADAQVNNQMPDLVNARPFEIEGDGDGALETVEFAAGFKADRTGYPAQWLTNGYSTVALANVRMVTHHTDNLPSIHKKTGGGAHTHHGLITFRNGNSGRPWADAAWSVETNPQTYDGGINWTTNWTLITEADLFSTPVYVPGDANVVFGNTGSRGATVRKRGAATLHLNGAQAYSVGSELVVEEGHVAFNTDPAMVIPGFTSPTGSPGRHLGLVVSNGAAAWCNAPTVGVDRVELDGLLDVAATSVVDVAADCALMAGGSLRVHASTSRAPLAVQGDFTAGGTLQVTNVTAYGLYELVTVGGAVRGTFDAAVLPSDGLVLYEADAVRLWVTNDWDADGIPNGWELGNGLSATNANTGVDSDGDGAFDLEEYIANTDPLDQLAALKVLAVSNAWDGTTVFLTTSTARLYGVDCSTDLADTNAWTTVTNDVPGIDGLHALPLPLSTNAFYRARARLP